jgi:predicted tellurium resistance membrane protein TerC
MRIVLLSPLLFLSANLPLASAIVARNPKLRATNSASSRAPEASSLSKRPRPVVALAQESSNASWSLLGEDEEAFALEDLGMDAMGGLGGLEGGLELAAAQKRKEGWKLWAHNRDQWKQYASDQYWKKQQMAKALAWQSTSNAKTIRDAALMKDHEMKKMMGRKAYLETEAVKKGALWKAEAFKKAVNDRDMLIVKAAQDAAWNPLALVETNSSATSSVFGTLEALFDDSLVDEVGIRRFHAITHARRHRHHGDIIYNHHRSLMEFLRTAHVLYVLFVLSSVAVFIWMYARFMHWPDPSTRHLTALGMWLLWASVCIGAVFFVRGADDAVGWTVGYLLELIFSIENCFIFHIICQAFKAPAHLTQKAIFAVILGQMIFQAIFFCGFAHWLHECFYLPYILGMWLCYVGFQSTHEHNEDNFDVRNTPAFSICGAIMGERLSPEFPEDGHMFFESRSGLNACTMVAPLALCLAVIDGLFEIDVTLTKIETLNHDFMCFSSSVVAACAVPELYYLGRQMFEEFHLLKYGVAWVLVFYGLQLLFHSFFELPALTGCILVMIVMALCMSCSSSYKCKTGDGETIERSVPQVTVFNVRFPVPCLDRQSSLTDVPSVR